MKRYISAYYIVKINYDVSTKKKGTTTASGIYRVSI